VISDWFGRLKSLVADIFMVAGVRNLRKKHHHRSQPGTTLLENYGI
jgi:hypothetical protein